MCRLLVLILLFVYSSTKGQQVMYVNTDNLIVRDRLDRDYNVSCIVHVPTRVIVQPVEGNFEGFESLSGKFSCIKFHFWQLNHFNTSEYGFVEKKYLVNSLSKITVKDADTTLTVSVTRTPFERHKYYRYDHSMHDMGMEFSNARDFKAPKYKGGNPLPLPPKSKPRVYHSGPRGGCYYYNEKGKKVYVAATYCAGK